MKIKRLIKMILIATSLIFCIFAGYSARAADKNIGTFSVSPVVSAHQSADVSAFFDIRWTPNGSDRIGVTIVNRSKEEKTYEIEVNKARTNSNGVIDYSDTNQEKKTAAQPTITSLVSFPKEVKIAANDSQTVYAQINFTNDDFNGIKMAGIQVKEKTAASKNKNGVQNVVAYVLPIVIRGNIDQRPTANVVFGKIKLVKDNFHTYQLELPVTNENENLLKDTKISMTVKNKTGKTIEKQEKTITVTPETSFSYVTKLAKTYDSGTYTVAATFTQQGKTWETKQRITISEDQVKKINQTNAKKSSENQFYKLIILIVSVVLGIIIVAGIALIIYTKSKKKKRKSSHSKQRRARNK